METLPRRPAPRVTRTLDNPLNLPTARRSRAAIAAGRAGVGTGVSRAPFRNARSAPGPDRHPSSSPSRFRNEGDEQRGLRWGGVEEERSSKVPEQREKESEESHVHGPNYCQCAGEEAKHPALALPNEIKAQLLINEEWGSAGASPRVGTYICHSACRSHSCVTQHPAHSSCICTASSVWGRRGGGCAFTCKRVRPPDCVFV